VFGVLAFPAIPPNGEVVFQEVVLVANLHELITIRKTPVGQAACEFDEARDTALRNGSPPGLCLHVVVDEIAERFLTMVDGFDDSIDDLEDHVRE
jgi:Mg2+ and Co2+ transporter CorA